MAYPCAFPDGDSANGDFVSKKTKNVLTEERPNPYISRWSVIYCKRGVARMHGGLPSRTRVRVGAEFVNKWPAGGQRWTARDASDGGVIQDAIKGG